MDWEVLGALALVAVVWAFIGWTIGWVMGTRAKLKATHGVLMERLAQRCEDCPHYKLRRP
jgi:hypothetical protein